VEKDGEVAQSVFNMLKAYMGADWDVGVMECPRTGSPLHRFKDKWTSDGGFSSTCPNLLTYTLVALDTLNELNKVNHDFVYQSLLLYSQQCSIEASLQTQRASGHHFHISCKSYLRPIEEVKVSSSIIYNPASDWAGIVKYTLLEKKIKFK